MKKTAKKLFSLLLAFTVLFSAYPTVRLSVEADEVQPDVATEVETEAAVEETEETEEIVVSGETGFTASLLDTSNVELDTEDPAIIAVESELREMKVLNAEGEPVPLTEAQIQEVLGMFQMYLDHWAANADVLGVQTPFFLSFNDNGEDGLGVLGEMLALAEGASVEAVRAGYMTYDDLTGMIMNFYFGDMLGIQFYGDIVRAARDEAMQVIKNSGAKTEAQKLLVLNEWLAEKANFDMPYIMGSDTMAAETPVQHPYYDAVYQVIYEQYEGQIRDQFEGQIRAGLEAEFKVRYYTAAIENVYSEMMYGAAYENAYPDIYAAIEQSVYDEAYKAAYDEAYKAAYDEAIKEKEEENTQPDDSDSTADSNSSTDPDSSSESGSTEEPESPAESGSTEDPNSPAESGSTEDPNSPAESDNASESTADSAETVEAEGEEPTEPEIDPEADAIAKAAAEEAATAAAEKAVADQADTIKAAAEQEADAQAAAYAEQATSDFMTANEAAIKEDPVKFVDTYTMEDGTALFLMEAPVKDAEGNYVLDAEGNQVMMTIAAQLHAGWDQFWEDAHENGVEIEPGSGYKMTVDEIVAMSMDTPQEDPMLMKIDADGNPILDENGNPQYMTPNEAIPVFADQAAQGLTDGILNYWEGTQFGALAEGKAVCLGYAKAYTYLVQFMHPEIYGKNGAETDMTVAANWKSAKELCYDENGNLDTNAAYCVDFVRISFDASVTMFGETQDNFNSDHYWNAIKIDGQWYYVDPCYTDVYVEVMARDRAETDGNVNHMYFLFSHNSAESLYEGNYSEIRTLYKSIATDTKYEDAWMARSISDTKSDGQYFYYVYSSSDMITMMDSINNSDDSSLDMNYEYKLVRHAIDDNDLDANGDSDYETFIEFNHPVDEEGSETVARVYNPATKALEENAFITELYAQHQADSSNYPSLCLTCAYYENGVYFNLSNYLLRYDIATGAIAIVKEYTEVSAQRDKTNGFGAMAFDVVDASQADLTVENHPIAGIILKNDGKLYVSIATNYSFISGKETDGTTHEAPENPAAVGEYGYEYEETNYNAGYSNYDMGDMNFGSIMEQFGYTEDVNDNDEFMWSANFVETQSMNSVAVTSCAEHTYEAVTVPADCTHNEYTVNICSTCHAVDAATYAEKADTQAKHHYIYHAETYYTKDDNGAWNKGECYVCADCYASIEEPTEPAENANWGSTDTTYEEQYANYLVELEKWEAARDDGGHTYKILDPVWSEDNTTVSFTQVECTADCLKHAAVIDVLLDDTTMSMTLEDAVTVSTQVAGEPEGRCDEGIKVNYEAAGRLASGSYYIYETKTLPAGQHAYEATWTWEATETGYEAVVDVICSGCGDAHEDVAATVVKDEERSSAATPEKAGQNVYVATADLIRDDKVVGTVKDEKVDLLLAAPTVTTTYVAATGSIRLLWNTINGANAYDVYRADTENGEYTLVRTTSSTEYIDVNSVEGTRYYYYVVAAYGDAKSGASNTVNAMAACSRPEVIAEVDEVTGKIVLSWEAVTGAVNYEITAAAGDGDAEVIATTANTSYTHDTAVVGTTYKYTVKALAGSAEANSAASEADSAMAICAQPVVTIANVASSGKIQLKWTAVEGAASYEVYRASSEDGEYELIKTATGTSYTNTSAKAGEKFWYKVKAICEVPEASSVDSKVVSRMCDLAQPKITLTNDAATGKVKVSWNKVEGAVKYQVYRSKTQNGTYALMKTVTGTSMINANGVENTLYYYKVRAVASNTNANSAFSAIKSRRVDLAQPTITLTNDAATGKVKISWNKVKGAVKYQVYRSTSKNGEYTRLSTVTGTSMINKNGVTGKQYYYKVIAVAENTAANSAYSAAKSRRVDLARPVVKITRNNAGLPKLTWAKVSGAVKYKVYRATTQNGKYTLMKTVTGTSYVNNNAKAGKTYYYKVIAVHKDTNCNSAYSVVKSIKAK